MDKILYTDGDKDRLLKGQIISEDDYFINLKLPNGRLYRIGKKSIISIRQGEDNGREDKKHDLHT